jgi:hypothetical protein
VSATAYATQPCCAALFERVQVKACVLKCPCWRAGPAGVARPNVLVQRNKGYEAELWEQRENRAEVGEIGSIIDAPYVFVYALTVSPSGDGKRRLDDVRPIVLYGLPGDEKTNFDQRESVDGRVAYVSGEGRGAREDNSPKVRPQRRSRARCCGASSSGNGRPTKVTVSAPAGKVALLSLTGLRAWYKVRKVGQQGWVHKGTYVLQFPERFTPRRLHTRPYASIKCLPCVRIPPVVSRDQSWAWDGTDPTT